MTQRHYLTHGLDSLEALFEAHRDDPEILEALTAELEFRTEEPAERLRSQVASARERLVRPAEPEPNRLFTALRDRLARFSPTDPLLHDPRLPDGETILRFPKEAPDDVWRKLIVDGETLDLAAQTEARLVSPEERREALRAALDLRRPAPRLEAAPPPELFLARLRGGRGGRRLQTGLSPAALDERLGGLIEEAGLFRQETGRGGVFLIFGILEWRDPERPDARRLAPLLLLPAHLERDEYGDAATTLAATAPTAERNPLLSRWLEQRFGSPFPHFPPSVPDDETPIATWFDAVDAAVENLDGFAVRRHVTLAALRIGRRALFEDLDPRHLPESPSTHPLTAPILRALSAPRPAARPEPPPPDASESETLSPLLIHDADAIEHAAVADTAGGRNPVILAPPGTAASRTIANIVADAMAKGKSVLVLAEKEAALDAVKQRLDEAGLGLFCLELYGDKVAPRTILRSLRERMGPQSRLAPPRPDLAARDAAAKDLAAYAAALHDPQGKDETVFSLIWRFVSGATRHASAARAFRGVEIPEALLSEPAQALRVGRDLVLHAETVDRYAAEFGDPAESPWGRIGLDAGPRDSAARLVDSLEEAQRSASDLAELLRESSDLGLAGLDDLRRVIAAPLPDAQDLSAVSRVAGLDLDQLQEAVALRRAILDCLNDLAEAGPLMALDDAILPQAAIVAAAARTCAFAEVPPAEAYARAENEMRDAQQLTAAMMGLVGALPLLGFDEDAESRLLMGVAAAVEVAASIPTTLRRWLFWEPRGTPENFEQIATHGKALGEAEAAWRRDIPGYDTTGRPNPAALRAAAAAFRKAGLKRMFSSLSGDLKLARALCEELGISGPEEERPEILEKLADHVEAVDAFETDESIAWVIGAVWAGVDTPFGVMIGAYKVRAAIRDGLSEFHLGHEIADRMLRLDERGVTEFGAFAPAALAFRSITIARTLGRESIRNSVRRFEEAIVRLTAFVGRDPYGDFSPIPFSIERVAALAEREIQRRALVAALAGNPASDAFADSELGAVDDAIVWVRGLAESPISATLRGRLMSDAAQDIRRRLITLSRRAAETLASLNAALHGLTKEFGLSDFASDDAETIARRAQEYLRHAEALPAFFALRTSDAEIERLGLRTFLERARQNRIRTQDLGDIFVHLVLRRRIEALRLARPALSRGGAAMESRRRAFAEQDRAKMEKDRAAIRSLLFTTAHASESVRAGARSLERETRRDRGFAGLSPLMQEAGDAILTLKPCILASPATVAEHLPRETRFDLLVIAEASQMPLELALGGLLRASGVAIVGDPAGAPARDFFLDDGSGAAPSGAEDAEAEAAISVLEAGAAAFGPLRRLRRHDEDGCDSLLAFSNRLLYGNQISLPPSPRPGAFAVDLFRVPGEAADGRNEAEAEQIVEEALAFMRRFSDHHEDDLPTFGIVAATAEQSALIRARLRASEADDESVARYREKATRRGEAVFVKSLDTVQGDRRDCILASLVYDRAQAAEGRLGLFTERYGVRFVNILATRARLRLGLAASLASEDLRTDETAPPGARLLGAWLSYVESRGRAPKPDGVFSEAGTLSREFFPDEADARPSTPASLFQTEMASRLETRGFEIVSSIGRSPGDTLLGVRHPSRPDVWLAGLEADGLLDPSATNPRDRDRLRDEALRRRGWDLLRVWSTDWFDDPDLQTNRLLIHLETLRRKEAAPEEPYFTSGKQSSPAGESVP